jgi:hypothetical protein
MQYLNIYNQLIEKAKHRDTPKPYEKHHVIPKSLGGANNTLNLVKLTIREHFVAHRLLTKIHSGKAQKKMWFAYYRLCNRHQITNSRAYEVSKLQAKKYLSEIHTGKTISENHKKAIQEKCKGMVGYKHSATSKSLMTNAKIGNTHAKVGVDIIDISTNLVVESVNSVSNLCKMFNLTRGQVEHYIYKQRPYNNLLFVRQRIIKRK